MASARRVNQHASVDRSSRGVAGRRFAGVACMLAALALSALGILVAGGEPAGAVRAASGVGARSGEPAARGHIRTARRQEEQVGVRPVERGIARRGHDGHPVPIVPLGGTIALALAAVAASLAALAAARCPAAGVISPRDGRGPPLVSIA